MKLYKFILMVLLSNTLNIDARTPTHIPKEVIENMTSSNQCKATNAALAAFNSALQEKETDSTFFGKAASKLYEFFSKTTEWPIERLIPVITKNRERMNPKIEEAKTFLGTEFPIIKSIRKAGGEITEKAIENLTPVITKIRKDITPKIEEVKTSLFSKLPAVESIRKTGGEITEKAVKNLTPVIAKTQKDMALKIEEAKTFLAAKLPRVESIRKTGGEITEKAFKKLTPVIAKTQITASTKMECGNLESKLSNFNKALENLEPNTEITSNSTNRFFDTLTNRWVISAAVTVGIIIYARYKYKQSQEQTEEDDYGL